MVLIFAIFFSMSSCEDEDDFFQADLKVYVSGTLSSNPRSGLRVTVYTTENDAENEVNEYTSTQITDDDGFVFFQNLEHNVRYWVRVNSVLIKNIKRSGTLRVGLNEMSMSIL